MTSRLQNAYRALHARQWVAVVLATLAGASVWVSLGTVAVTNPTTMGRIAALPPWWWLAGLASAGGFIGVVSRLSVSRAWPLSLSLLLWLPYLPGQVPAAFLTWQGPLEGLVWMAICAGVIAAGSQSRWLAPLLVADQKRSTWLAAGIMAVVSLAAFGSVRPVIPGGDEPHYLVITQSLLLDGDLRIENNHTRGDYLSYFAGRLRPDFMTRGADAQIYSIHSPGVSALVLPGFALAGYPGAVATLILLAALASAITWRTAWLLSASVGGAWVGWAAVFLSSPFLFHAFAIYPDGPAALIVIATAWLLVHAEVGRPLPPTAVWTVSAGLAALPWLHTRFAFLAAAAGLCLFARFVTRQDRRALLMALLLVPAVAALAWFGYFLLIWNTPNPAAPYGADPGAALAYMGRGITGLLVDQQFGLLAAAPVYACAMIGVLVLARSRPRLVVELTVIAMPYLLVTATYAMWWGGISSPARFLTALTPLAALPIAAWWPRQSAGTRTVTLLLLLISVAAVWPRAFVDAGRLLYSDRSGYDLVLGWSAQLVDLPLAFPSVHRDAVPGALRDAAVWLAAGALLMVATRVVGDRTTPAGQWTIVAWTAAIGLMAGASVVWARHGDRVVTPGRSQVAALDAFRHDWSTTFLRLRPFRTLSADEFLRQASFPSTDRLAPAVSDPTLFRAAAVPAGDYEILISGVAPAGVSTMVLGRNDSAIERWSLAEPAPGQVAGRFRLPVDVASLTIRGTGRGDPAAMGLRLRATGLADPVNADGRRAVRAARYGRARVFAFDERAYLEPTGFWTRADAAASLVIDTDSLDLTLGLPVIVRAGAVATTLELSVGDWSRRLSLAAGQQESVQLPPLNGARGWALMIRSGPGFRPSAIDPASDDVRQLAAWVELP